MFILIHFVVSSPVELPRAFNKDSRCSVWVSMLEVYNENVYDLLAPISKGIATTKSTVKLLSDGMGNFIPQGISFLVTSQLFGSMQNFLATSKLELHKLYKFL
jgi:hypothetical protein